MKTLEEKAEEYTENAYIVFPQSAVKSAFIAGYKAAFEWINVDDELPENETYINIKLKNGDLGARFYESIDKDMLLNTSTHWRPINND